MAEALLTIMLENLNSLIQKEFGLLWGVNKEMERLSSILSTIHDVLEDAEEKQLRNREIKNWLQKLKDVSGELDDILDECSMEASLLEHKMQRFQKMSSSMAQAKLPHRLYFPSLRAFDIKDSFILKLKSLSTLISNSKHLRYLNFSRTNIRILPESICLLVNLQTLDVSECYNLEKLPKHMSRMRSLRHLYIEGCRSLNHMPPNIGKLSCLRSLSRFIVDRRRGCDIDELESLLNLGGSLRIEHLEKVKSPMKAKKANLVGKTNLQRLHLHWYYNLNEVGDQKLNEQVLDALEPPLTLELLEISNFRGGHLPHWFSANFENLVSICLNGWQNSLELPTAMGKLPSLTSLYLRGMDCLRYVDNESYNGQLFGGFFRLENLQIHNLPNLEKLCRAERSDVFPRLSYLHIDGCPKLTSLHCLQSIQDLNILGCNETVLESVANLHTLTSLYISDNDDLASFPSGVLHHLTALKALKIVRFRKLQHLQSDMLIGLTALKELSIRYCDMLECFPVGIFQGLNSLRRMRIENCNKLKSLSDSFGDLTALETLEVSGSSELETFPNGLNNLSSLQRLTLSKLAALPDNFQHLPCLQDMSISGFPNLELLPNWLGDLTSLCSLSISNCPSLEYLPTSIQFLTNLQSLHIGDCPKLVERCKMEMGEDWPRIAHVERVKKAVISEHLIYLQSQAECFYVLLLIVTIFTHRDKSAVLLTSGSEIFKFGFAVPEQKVRTAGSAIMKNLKDVAAELDDILDELDEVSNTSPGLQSLEMKLCPVSVERCRKVTGEDWHKIAHIPHVDMQNPCYRQYRLQIVASSSGNGFFADDILL
ncbi:hypothetical protein FEM48_Zijuj11G0147000 [Ziziphus jujuba var. spinosa]|uniref:Rx N-terminal domain-containing protein n=1 Tax=Ziziphus jujuba var. spinosa TaxID=714518 RepID=A0A978UJJ2_ZIZJJ|nr:hypothetical protein FEM48_Zijuj11G0147000 [Ziziphus jujuba var. spinosa]